MHIPDGFLNTPVWATLDAVSLPAVGWLARRAQKEIPETRIPLLGVMGAFVFAAQMINFPVAVGTSSHLVGAALLAYTLGPAPATIVMAAILAIQAFLFQDGGVVALGANVFNMAIAGVLAGYLPYYFWGRNRWTIFLGGVISLLLSACLALGELLLSGVRMPVAMLWFSLGVFLVSAVLEGAITLAVMQGIERLNPAWIRQPVAPRRRLVGALAGAAALLAGAGVLFASTAPDGLERLAGRLGLVEHAFGGAPLANYQIHLFESAWLSKATAGLAGVVLIYVACVLFGKVLARSRASRRSR